VPGSKDIRGGAVNNQLGYTCTKKNDKKTIHLIECKINNICPEIPAFKSYTLCGIPNNEIDVDQSALPLLNSLEHPLKELFCKKCLDCLSQT